jgi:FMN-dependent NADH-azoreductase
MKKILHLDASGRHEPSVSRKLSAQIIERIKGSSHVTYRDIGKGISFVNDLMIEGYFTQKNKLSDKQKKSLELSDIITRELLAHDIYVFGMPMYNFSMPASFKAWCDLVARAGITFKYTSDGPVGLLEGKKAYIAIASDATNMGSETDFLTPWLRYFLKFLGVKDIEIIAAEYLSRNADEAIAKAEAHIKTLKEV